MSLDSLVSDAVYSTLVAEDATYIDGSGDELPVRVVPVHDAELLLPGASIGVQGVRQAFFMRKSALSCAPAKGDRIVTTEAGVDYCIDDRPIDYNPTEWLIYVVT